MPKLPPLALAATVLLMLACGDSTSPEDARVATDLQLSVTSVALDDGATTTVSVTVLDQDGTAFQTPPAGTTITWQVDDPATVGVTPTNDGLEAQLTGLRPGSTQVRASLAGRQATVTVTVNAVPTQLVLVGGSGQSAGVGEPLDDALIVRVLDRHGDGVGGVTVQFSVVAGGGTLSATSATTAGDGRAETVWTLGPEPGEQSARAEVANVTGSPVTFTAVATELVPQGTVEGVITAADGVTPIQGAVVTVVPENNAQAFVGGSPGVGAQNDGPQAVTDVEGRYVLEGVPAGPRTLMARRGVFVAFIQVEVLADQTVTAPTGALQPEGELAYVPGLFDAMEDVLALYGIQAVQIAPADLASSAVTSQYAMIFINCGVDAFIGNTATVNNLRAYVEAGGLLYVSDLELPLVIDMFPEDILDVGDGDAQTVQATVEDGGLVAFLGGQTTVSIGYNFDGWMGLAEISSRPEVLLRGSYSGFPDGVDEPLAVFIDHGAGQVVFTTFHNNAQATDDQFAVLRYFVFEAGHQGAAGAPFTALPLSAERLRSLPVQAVDPELEHRHRHWRER